jgi:hypothetical protein
VSDRRDLLVAVTRDDASGLIVSYLAEGGRLVGMRLVLPRRDLCEVATRDAYLEMVAAACM